MEVRLSFYCSLRSDATLGSSITITTYECEQQFQQRPKWKSGAGVGFTRDPAFGDPALWVDFLFNSQGEDAVSGRRDTHGHDELAAALPAVWQSLQAAASQLEQAFRDMQDFEFAVQEGDLYLLQTPAGKRMPYATSRIALDLLDTGLLTQHGAHTSHAAVVARQLGKVCLISCSELQIEEAAGCIRIRDRSLQVDDLLTLDGNDGAIYAGAAKTEADYPEALLARLELLSEVGS